MLKASCLMLAVSLTCFGLAGRAAASDDALLPDLQEIVDRGKLVIAVVDWNLPPMVEVSEDGELSGFDIDLANEIAESLGVTAEFLKISGSQRNVVRSVSENKADIGVSYLSLNVADGRHTYFTKPYIVQSSTILINRKRSAGRFQTCPGQEDILALLKAPGTVGVLGNASYASSISGRRPDAKPEHFGSFDDMMRAVSEGEILASLQGEVAAKSYLARNPASSIRLKLCDTPGRPDKIGIVVRPDAPDLLRWLNLYLEVRGAGIDVDQVIQRHEPVQ